jgi:hypothetical protein
MTRLWILGHPELIAEIEEVANRPKIAKYIDIDKVKAFIEVMQERLDFVSYHSQLNVCRDEADNYLLALALDNEANYLITGDKDLLVLNPYEHAIITTLTDFEELMGMA